MTSVSVSDGPQALAVADVDNDGYMDLVVGHTNSDDLLVLKSAGNNIWTVGSPVSAHGKPQAMAAADLNGDGWIDLAIANQNLAAVSVFIGDGQGGFIFGNHFSLSDWASDITAADLDGDGDLDLVTAKGYSGDLGILYNDGFASFGAEEPWLVASGHDIRAVGAIDVDGDGDLDLAAADRTGNEVAVFRQYLCGDANGDNSVNLGDVVHLRNFIFFEGPPPIPYGAGDANGDGSVNVGDMVYIVNYVFKGGPPPLCFAEGGAAKLSASSPVLLRADYDGERTIIEMSSPVDIFGIEIELAGKNISEIHSPVTSVQLLTPDAPEGTAVVGLLDMEGSGHISSGKTEILTIQGLAVILSGYASDGAGRSYPLEISTAKESNVLPTEFSLGQNYPNPFNPQTAINFALPEPSIISLEVYNVMGQKVTTLAEGQWNAGIHQITWDASTVASGVYFYRLSTEDFVETKKMVLLK